MIEDLDKYKILKVVDQMQDVQAIDIFKQEAEEAANELAIKGESKDVLAAFSQLEKQDYENKVKILMCAGRSNYDIISEMYEYGVTIEQTKKFIRNVNKAFKELSTEDDAEMKLKLEEQYYTLYQKAFLAGDYKTAKAILDSLTRLHNLSTVKSTKVNMTYNIDFSN